MCVLWRAGCGHLVGRTLLRHSPPFFFEHFFKRFSNTFSNATSRIVTISAGAVYDCLVLMVVACSGLVWRLVAWSLFSCLACPRSGPGPGFAMLAGFARPYHDLIVQGKRKAPAECGGCFLGWWWRLVFVHFFNVVTLLCDVALVALILNIIESEVFTEVVEVNLFASLDFHIDDILNRDAESFFLH